MPAWHVYPSPPVRRRKIPALSHTDIFSQLIVPFPDLSFRVQWSQQIMHHLGVCLSIRMNWNIGYVMNLSQCYRGKVTKWFSALFGSLVQFVVAKKQRFVVRVGAAHVAPSIASLGQLCYSASGRYQPAQTRLAHQPSLKFSAVS
jgi:hypothetical protein